MISEDDLLARFEGVRQVRDNEWMVCCSAHPDRNPSLHLTLKDQWIVHCFAGCETPDVLGAVELTYADISNGNGSRPFEPIAIYTYTDENGTPLFEVGRFPEKRFPQRLPGRDTWKGGIGDVRRVLYRLPKVLAAIKAGTTIYVVEGEKDVLAIERAGGVATCNPGGAGKWRREYSDLLAGASVVVVIDQDSPGHDHAASVVSSLRAAGVHATPVKPADGKDASDHFAKGYKLEDFVCTEETVWLVAIPSYPVAVLPEVAQRIVATGRSGGIPEALTAGAALGALAGAIGPRAEIEIWNERAIIWPALIAPRGAGKSPALALAFGPLREHDAQLEDDQATIRLGDMTLEALARALHRTEGAAALDIDELAQLLRGMGEYKGGGGGDRGRLLSLWDGAPWSFQRVAGGKTTNKLDIRIARPTVVICGTLQPSLHELLGGEADGFRPRWLPHLAEMPAAVEGDLSHGAPDPSWQDLIGNLLEHRATLRRWRLDGAARVAFQGYRVDWKRQARGIEPAGVSAALDKADRHLARIALVIAEAEAPGRKDGYVTSRQVHRAAEIVDFTLDCWRALPEQGGLGLSRRDEKLDRAVELLRDWLEQHGKTAMRRELMRAHVSGVRTADDLNALLAHYQATYPGTVTEAAPPGGGPKAVLVRAPMRRAAR